MNKYLIKYLCLSTLFLFLFGCSASLEQRVDKTDSVDSRQLEKKINDLSDTISLIVHDANRLHNDVEEVKTSNKTIQEKFEGLEETVRNLNEQIGSLSSFVKTSVMVQPPSEKTDVKPQLSITDSSTPSEKPASDIQKTVNAKDQLAVAKGFWDAMNAKDVQAVRLYVTRESRDKLQIKGNNTTTNCKATFGDIKIENDKTTIETTMQTYEGTTGSEVKMQTVLINEDGQWKVDANQTMMSMFGGAMGEIMKGLGKALEEGFTKGMQEMGKTMAEGMQKGFEEMAETSEAKPDITPKLETTNVDQTTEVDLEELKQDNEAKPLNIPSPTLIQETVAISKIVDQTKSEGIQKGAEERTQTIEAKSDITPSKQETAVISKTTEEAKPEGMQKDAEGIVQSSESKPETTPQPKLETALISEPTQREIFLKENIVRLAEAEFPDNKGIQWNILSFEHKAHLTYVEVEPGPVTVGYSRFKFIVSFKNPEIPRVIGISGFKDGQYSLLSMKKK